MTTAAERPAVALADDPVVVAGRRYVGGAPGSHAAPRRMRWRTAVRILLILTALTSLFGYLQKSPCRTHLWTNDYQYTRVCYTDLFALYTAEHLGGDVQKGTRLGVPYRDHPVEYPVVIGGLMWAGAEVTNLIHPDDPQVVDGQVVADSRGETFFDVSVLLLAMCALLVTWAVARMAGAQRVWDTAMVALSPLLIFDGFINWDLAAVALTCLGLLAWARRRPVWCGVLLGLGVATKLYPALVLLALLPLCVRADRLRAWGLAAAGAVGSFLLAYVPVALFLSHNFPFPDPTCAHRHQLAGWRFFFSLSQTRGGDWGSPWLSLRYLREHVSWLGWLPALDANRPCGSAPTLLNVLGLLAMLLVIGLVFLLVLGARRRPRLAQVAFLLVAGFILVNKVDSPQYCVWLLPLAVLARPRWGPLLVWQATEILLTVANFLALVHAGNPQHGIPDGTYQGMFLIRDIALLWLCSLVVREVLHPDRDVVRAGGRDDPIGGVLDDAPDAVAFSARSAAPAYAAS